MTGQNKHSCSESPSWNGTFIFDPADAIYTVHFPTQPVVPGSLIIHAFMEAARSALPIRNFLFEDFRFREFVQPGGYPYRIEKSGSRLRCSLFSQNRLLVAGVLIDDDCASPAPEPLRQTTREGGRL